LTIPYYALLGVNTGLYKTPEQMNALVSNPDVQDILKEELAQFGFFRRFVDGHLHLNALIEQGNALYQDMHSPPEIPTQAEMQEEMAYPETTWQLLASGIPERSFAVGANSLKALTESRIGVERNYNLHDYRVSIEGSQGGIYWPQERLDSGPDELDWLHSDMIGVAFPYVQSFYEQMVNIVEN